MFKLDKVMIQKEYYSLLKELKNSLPIENSYLLRSIKNLGQSATVTCPYHKGGVESKPSASLYTSQDKTAFFHCFSCGKTIPIEQFIQDCLLLDSPKQAKEWLHKHSNSFEYDELIIELDREEKKNSFVSEQELETYRKFHPYMYERKLTDELIKTFDIGYDSNFKGLECITFPVRDLYGNTLFVARRGIFLKFFDYPPGCKMPLYGIYELSLYEKGLTEEEKESMSLIICESMLDCLTSWRYGQPAIALNGLGNRSQIDSLRRLSVVNFILALDNDTAGIKAKNKLVKELGFSKSVSLFSFKEGRKDLNELLEEEFIKGLELKDNTDGIKK